MAIAWNADTEETLCRLWLDGKTMREIGAEMHLSRHAVSGKVHRMNLPARRSPIRRENAPRREIVRVMFPDNDLDVIAAACNQIPGPPVDGGWVRMIAGNLNVPRSPEWRASHREEHRDRAARARAVIVAMGVERGEVAATPERKALVTELFPDTELDTIIRRVNALPGPAMNRASVRTLADRMGVRRSDGWKGRVRIAVTRPAPRPAATPTPPPAPRIAVTRPAHDFGRFFEPDAELPARPRIAPSPTFRIGAIGAAPTCQWIDGEVGMGRMPVLCGAESDAGVSWCGLHRARVFHRVRDQRADAAA